MENKQTEDSGKRKSNRSPPYALFNLLVIVVAIFYGIYYQMYIAKDPKAKEESPDVSSGDDMVKIPLFTTDELKKFDGVSK
jgi:hypothetical protein